MYKPEKYNLANYNFIFGFKVLGNGVDYLNDPTYFKVTSQQVTVKK